MKKRLISVILLVCMILCLFPALKENVNAVISLNAYETKVLEFIKDSRWKNGTSWGAISPKLSTYSSSGCCAFAADFAAYVYGSKSLVWNTSDFTKFTDANDIKTGDIIQISGHWFVVLRRTGNTLDTAEGSYDNKVRVTNVGWSIKDGKIYKNDTKEYRAMVYGYHYKFTSAYETKVDEFLKDSRWKNGISWGAIKPKLSTYSSSGCCAYAADFAAYVYGSKSLAWNTSDFTKFTGANNIATGDIIQISGHWFIVLKRTGNTLYTAEGSYDKKVRITTNGWSIKDGKIYKNDTKEYRDMICGYHYKYVDSVTTSSCYFSDLPSRMNVGSTDAVIAQKLNKDSGTSLNAYGARIYNAYGAQLASTQTTPSGTYANLTYVEMWYTVSSAMKLTLLPGYTYQFEFWATVDGKTCTSPRKSFTMPGTATYNNFCYDNYSGKNYFYDSAFINGLNTWTYSSRDKNIYTLSADSSVKHVAKYNTLKIVGTAAGSSDHDLAFCTQTQTSQIYDGGCCDNNDMTLSFWGKASVNGTKMYFRWGYQSASDVVSVTLTTDWAFYTVPMNKTVVCGNYIHPYFDRVGTVWMSEMQLEEGTAATEFVPEIGDSTAFTSTRGDTYRNLSTPVRDGYRFDGWYTAASGGELVTQSTPVVDGNLRLYAHWSTINTHTHTFGNWTTLIPATCTKSGTQQRVCTMCEQTEQRVINALGHNYSTEWTIDMPATATSVGYKSRHCTHCDAKNDVTEIPVNSVDNIFTDVKCGAWYVDAVQYAVDNGLFSGVSKNRFAPDMAMTRAMLVEVLYNLENRPCLEGKESVFTDVKKNDWFAEAVMWAQASGVVYGKTDTIFAPNESITREQLSAILYRYAALKKHNVTATAELTAFPDGNRVSGYAESAIKWAIGAGLISGNKIGNINMLDARGTATRAQVALILKRYSSVAM